LEGIPYQNPVSRAGYLIKRVQDFSTYLLEPSNRVIGDVLGRALLYSGYKSSNAWKSHLKKIEPRPGCSTCWPDRSYANYDG
jgi:hypothetical protein